jgi:hypothetical protein
VAEKAIERTKPGERSPDQEQAKQGEIAEWGLQRPIEAEQHDTRHETDHTIPTADVAEHCTRPFIEAR